MSPRHRAAAALGLAVAAAVLLAPATLAPALAAPPKLVFLGSPQCVCVVLRTLWEAAADTPFELSGVVTQPPRRVRGVVTQTPVHDLAEELGVRRIWTPEVAKDKTFLSELEELGPDVCITAAYGQYLPRRFLRTPRLGTLNLHPSLLPRWRGAAPVQRSLVAGDAETGITILYSTAKMDAGPIALQRAEPLNGEETAGEVLDRMFSLGSQLLVRDVLPRVFSGDISQKTAQTQDEDQVTMAPLISKEEGRLQPHNETARQLRDKVRGFDGWPGTTLPIACSGSKAPVEARRIRVRGASVALAEELPGDAGSRPPQELIYWKARKAVGLRPALDPEHVLLVTELQLPGKNWVPALTFWKGYMKTQPARWLDPEEETALVEAAAKAPKVKKDRRR